MESPTESATCTICGLKCDERSAFNAHIRAHLKDKLTNRRKLQQQKPANSPSSSSSASCPQPPQQPQQPRDSIKRAKVVTTSSHSPQQQQPSMIVNKPVKDKSLTNITSLLPSSPLPMTQATLVKEKPDLEALLSQLKQPSRDNPMVMAELAACKPIPPKADEVVKKKFNSPQPLAQTKVTSINTPCTPEISDMEDDLMSYEMEMNRIDFHNDLAFLLDQIEKDFEGPCIGQDFRLDTPPDSDCETDSFGRLLNQISTSSTVTSSSTLSQAQDVPSSAPPDLLGLDRFARRIDDNLLNPPTMIPTSLQSESIRLVQSPASVAKVGKLPAKTLAVLNKLPAKLFVPNQQLSILPPSFGGKSEQRFVDVVKVESSSGVSSNNPLNGVMNGQFLQSSGTAGAQCIINIECRNPNEPAKIIQTYRAIDTGTEIKLVPADLPIKMESVEEPMTPMATATVSDEAKSKANVASTSHCPICNKCITNKNMARHLEKHQNTENNASEERKFTCKFCCKSFSQRSHLSRHAKAHTSVKGDLLTCKVCGKVCKNRISLVRHRTKHLSCVHCSALFDNKITLQDHLLKAHPEKAIVSLVQPPEPDTRLDLDDLGSIGSAASHSVDYSFSPSAASSGPHEVSSIGDSLAEIADTNYFYCGGSDITDDLYSTDIFSAAASAAATATTC